MAEEKDDLQTSIKNHSDRKLSRTHTWYEKQSKPVKVIIVVIMLSVLILLLEGLLLVGLWVESLRGGLSVFVEPHSDNVELQLGGNSNVSFDISVQNLPLCRATCDWQIVRHDSNETVSSGSDTILSGTTNTLTVVIDGSSERREFPVVLSAKCENEEARHCQRNPEPSIARTTTLISFADTDTSKIARDYLEGEGRLRTIQRQELFAELEAISQLDSSIIPNLKSNAAAQAMLINQSLNELRNAFNNDNPIRARAVLETEVDMSAYEEYQNAVRVETEAINALNIAVSNFEALRAIAMIATEEDRERIIALTSTIVLLSERANTTDIFQTNSQIEQSERAIRELISKYEPLIIRDAQQGFHYAREESQSMCRIKEYECQSIPLTRTINDTNSAFAVLETSCNVLRSLEQTQNAANIHFGRQVDPSMSLFEVEAMYNVSGLRNDPSFLQRESEILRLAKQGQSVNATVRERLAVRLDALSTNSFSFRSNCNFNLPIEISNYSIPQRSLPDVLETKVIRERFAFPSLQCCSFGNCTACNPSERYPVLFLHGHSFAESSLPEYNIQAFTKMAEALESIGYVYVGNIFPQTIISSQDSGLYKNVQSGISFTSTYYYDSFEEDKSTHITPRKSENIETYALRLREAIDSTLIKTGSDKVVIVAHSMGGLVARSYIATFGDSKVASLLMVGTPNYGVGDEVGLLCPLFGSNKECEDLKKDSFFLRKLNSFPPPKIPIMTIAGVGCKDGLHDGLVALDSVQLDYARNEIINGTCISRSEMLHGLMLKPERYPQTLELVSSFLYETGIKQ